MRLGFSFIDPVGKEGPWQIQSDAFNAHERCSCAYRTLFPVLADTHIQICLAHAFLKYARDTGCRGGAASICLECLHGQGTKTSIHSASAFCKYDQQDAGLACEFRNDNMKVVRKVRLSWNTCLFWNHKFSCRSFWSIFNGPLDFLNTFILTHSLLLVLYQTLSLFVLVRIWGIHRPFLMTLP